MALEKNFKTSDRTEMSLEKAFKFMAESRNSDGLWSDFLTLAGESVFWVSGYVGYALLRFDRSSDNKRWLEKVGLSILEHQNTDGGWGYGFRVPSDADSTSWCLLFLSKLGIQSKAKIDKALSFLLKHQNPFDGGFRTYAEPRKVGRYMMIDESVSFEGWASSQMCITAVAAQALMENNSAKGAEALEYIRQGQNAEGYWNPYWWTGKLYATSHSIEALKKKGNESDINLIIKGQKWISQTQLSDGSWTDSPDQESGWAFSTALAVNGLLANPQTIFNNQAKNGIKWLIEHQLPDGSWTPNHILRIPYPWTKDPWNQESWNVDGKAINAAIKDHHRLFTTATVFTALSQYKKMLENNTQ